MIKLTNLSRVFRTQDVETTALNNINLQVNEGEFLAIMGPSGCGKSTLLNVLSNASPKVASYPFTTLVPSVGVIDYPDDFRTITMADVPGLIEGAAENRGLGHRFLRHVERCRLLLFLIDMAAEDGRDPSEDFEHLRQELRDYDPKVADKPFLVVGNKNDEEVAVENLARFKKRFPDIEPFFISAVLEDGLDDVRQELLKKLS